MYHVRDYMHACACTTRKNRVGGWGAQSAQNSRCGGFICSGGGGAAESRSLGDEDGSCEVCAAGRNFTTRLNFTEPGLCRQACLLASGMRAAALKQECIDALDALKKATATMDAIDDPLSWSRDSYHVKAPRLLAASFPCSSGLSAVRPCFANEDAPVTFLTDALRREFYAEVTPMATDEDQATPSTVLDQAQRAALLDVDQVYRMLRAHEHAGRRARAKSVRKAYRSSLGDSDGGRDAVPVAEVG